ncbi:MAG: ABC transporter permease [Candidatus Delongbacteria bacterium]|nr:ABC transporter permease [Candidatus Delongbacteria bacterium]
MKNIFNIAKKETIDIIRDKRTLRAMFLIPLIIFPLLFIIISKISNNQSQKEIDKIIEVGIVNQNNAQLLIKLIQKDENIEDSQYNNASQLDSLIKSGIIDAGLIIEEDFDDKINSKSTGHISLLYKSSDQIVKDRLINVVKCYERLLVDKRLSVLNISKSEIEPIKIDTKDLSSDREKISNSIGGFLPYILIIFSFIGCTFPAIQFFSNEKEHGTLETLLIAPISKYELLFGKMIAIVLIGFITSLVSLIGLGIGIGKFSQSLPPELVEKMLSIIQPSSVIMLVSMLLPLIAFFAGILTFIANYANSYKEAQSIISPLTPIIALPAIIGLIPGIKLSFITAAIPITNIALATKEIIAGTINPTLFGMVLFYLLCYAVIVVSLSVKFINNESYLSKN